jgi:hypothetical protein
MVVATRPFARFELLPFQLPAVVAIDVNMHVDCGRRVPLSSCAPRLQALELG